MPGLPGTYGSTTITSTTAIPAVVAASGVSTTYLPPDATDFHVSASCDRLWMTPIGSETELASELLLRTDHTSPPLGLDYISEQVWIVWAHHCITTGHTIEVDQVTFDGMEMRWSLALVEPATPGPAGNERPWLVVSTSLPDPFHHSVAWDVTVR